MKPKEIKALVSLLDDSEIATQIEEKILTVGREAIPFLENEWERSSHAEVQKKIENLIHVLQYKVLQEKMEAWYSSPEQDVLTGLCLVSNYQYPNLEVEEIKNEIEKIYHEVWLEYDPDLHVQDKIKIINSVFFNKLKFSPNSKDFYAPSNSFINIVLQMHKGNPITLCMIYMLVAQKFKLPVYGVNLPSLFLLTYKDKQQQFYINVFNRGLIFTQQDILNSIQESQLVPRPSYFEPCSSVDIIRRMLRNLVISFDKLAEHKKAEEVKELLVHISALGDIDI